MLGERQVFEKIYGARTCLAFLPFHEQDNGVIVVTDLEVKENEVEGRISNIPLQKDLVGAFFGRIFNYDQDPTALDDPRPFNHTAKLVLNLFLLTLEQHAGSILDERYGKLERTIRNEFNRYRDAEKIIG